MDNGYNLPDLNKAFEMIFKGISAEGKEKAPARKTQEKKPVAKATKKPVAKKKATTNKKEKRRKERY